MSRLPVAIRLGIREFRGGLKGFGIFLACIALGVFAISGVASLAQGLNAGLARNGQALLGGDLAFDLVHRQASERELEFLESLGDVSQVATMRAMARLPGGADQTLVELKGVDEAYPLYGDMRLQGGGELGAALARRGGAFGAVAEEVLLARLNVGRGDRLLVGGIEVEITGAISREPDRVAGAFGFGPRLMISREAMAASGLVQPGSLVTWRYRVRMPDVTEEDLARIVAEARRRFPEAGWDIDTRLEAAPSLRRNIERLSQFLTLVGLTALVVGGVGVANAVRAYLDGRREVIATLKCLGATAGTIFAAYLTQIAILSAIGIVIGLVAGAALPLLVPGLLGTLLPFDVVPGLYWRELLVAVAYGALTALAFALWPLGRARDVPAAMLFRDRISERRGMPRFGIILAVAAVVLLLSGLAVGLASDRRVAAIYVGSAAAAFVLLRLVALGIMALARRLPRTAWTELRLALANIHRPGALTPSVVLSLGLGLCLLVSLTVIDANVQRQISTELPDRAPSFFFLDIQDSERDDFVGLLRAEAPEARVESVPMLRGRIVSLKGIPAQDYVAADDARWVLSGDRGITYTEQLPENSRVVEGAWWPPDYSGDPLVSFDAELARGLGLRIGDPIVINVLGRNITARVASLRTVEWETLGINFVMLFSPNTFRGAPHGHLATVTYPNGGSVQREVALLRSVTRAFPGVTSIRVKEALETVNELVADLAWAIRGASSITLIASILVLAGALAAGHRHRLYDAVVLKTLGATRPRLLAAFGLEYLALGVVTSVFGLLAGLAAAYVVVTQVMRLPFTPEVSAGLAAAAAALAITVVLGLVGTWRVLGQKPAPVLRNL